MGLYTYKICEVLPRDPEQKMGRPRRNVLIGWDGLTAKEVKLMRSVQEPRLRAGQIAELDGKIVARGPTGDADPDDADDVGPDDADDVSDTSDATTTDDADDTDLEDDADLEDGDADPRPDDPVAAPARPQRRRGPQRRPWWPDNVD